MFSSRVNAVLRALLPPQVVTRISRWLRVGSSPSPATPPITITLTPSYIRESSCKSNATKEHSLANFVSVLRPVRSVRSTHLVERPDSVSTSRSWSIRPRPSASWSNTRPTAPSSRSRTSSTPSWRPRGGVLHSSGSKGSPGAALVAQQRRKESPGTTRPSTHPGARTWSALRAPHHHCLLFSAQCPKWDQRPKARIAVAEGGKFSGKVSRCSACKCTTSAGHATCPCCEQGEGSFLLDQQHSGD